jgi:hypothetical protein
LILKAIKIISWTELQHTSYQGRYRRRKMWMACRQERQAKQKVYYTLLVLQQCSVERWNPTVDFIKGLLEEIESGRDC